MKNRILYIEDQPAQSITDDLKRFGFDVTVNNADNFDIALSDMKNETDAYLMDFRLTANRGKVDAPTFASTLRTFGDNHRSKPIVLISTEENLPAFENDFTSQDLFDFVVGKKAFRENIEKYSNRIVSLIESYKLIESESYDINKVLSIENHNIADYRLIEKLNTAKDKEDTYAFCRIIYYTLIRSIGMLVGKDVLAARLGIDKSSEDFELFLKTVSDCKYAGILSSSYERWWFHKVIEFWNGISGNRSLRRTSANERVAIINQALDLNLVPAAPLKHATSSNFWTICAVTNEPLDPNEGYVYSKKELEVWQEQEYISLYAALEYPEHKIYLSPIDKNEIFELSKNATF